MRVHCLFLLGCAALYAGPLEDSLATGRKALQNDGVSTAWRIAQKALSDAPDSAQAHEFAGEVLFRRGDFAQADAEFKNAVGLAPQFGLAWWGLGRVAECAAMSRTAAEDFKRAYELSPKDARILAAWIPRLRGQERAAALERYQAAMAASAESKEFQQQMVMARSLEGRRLMTLASPYRATEMPLLGFVSGVTHMRTYGVQVMVNGTPVKLVLDTGAAGIVMSKNAADRAGLTRISGATVAGIGDNAKASDGYRALAEKFQIGDVDYRNALISVSTQNIAGIEDGLIGSNVFAEFLITLDFAGGKLRLDPLPDYDSKELQDRREIPEMKDAARVFRFGHLLLVPVRVNSKTALFVLDTGAARSMMSYDLAAEASKANRDERTTISGLNGKVGDVYRTGDVLLEFAGFSQKNLGMTAIETWELSHRLGTEISGFLGLPLLDLFKLTIDYRDGMVKFERAR
jgi:predicted aspartyl protease